MLPDFFGDPEDSVRRIRPYTYPSYSSGKAGKKLVEHQVAFSELEFGE